MPHFDSVVARGLLWGALGGDGVRIKKASHCHGPSGRMQRDTTDYNKTRDLLQGERLLAGLQTDWLAGHRGPQEFLAQGEPGLGQRPLRVAHMAQGETAEGKVKVSPLKKEEAPELAKGRGHRGDTIWTDGSRLDNKRASGPGGASTWAGTRRSSTARSLRCSRR